MTRFVCPMTAGTLSMRDIRRLISRIQSTLSPDLLKSDWRRRGGHFTTGHCYVAAEALYHLLGGKEAGLTPMCGKSANGDTHWWLRDAKGRILDPTAEQFTSLRQQPPYRCGKGAGFLTKEPSQRARILLSRMEQDRRQNDTLSV